MCIRDRGVRTILNKKLEGLTYEWYSNGNLRTKGMFKNGSGNGTWNQYWPNGQIKGSTTLVNGEPNGQAKVWYDNGVKQNEGIFDSGKREGDWIYWDRNGEFEKREYYESGRLIYTRTEEQNNSKS